MNYTLGGVPERYLQRVGSSNTKQLTRSQAQERQQQEELRSKKIRGMTSDQQFAWTQRASCKRGPTKELWCDKHKDYFSKEGFRKMWVPSLQLANKLTYGRLLRTIGECVGTECGYDTETEGTNVCWDPNFHTYRTKFHKWMRRKRNIMKKTNRSPHPWSIRKPTWTDCEETMNRNNDADNLELPMSRGQSLEANCKCTITIRRAKLSCFTTNDSS